MGNQGSINMPTLQPAQIGAVLNALQAVHEFYGIDTQKQQQLLLGAQTQKAQAEADKSTQEQQDEKAYSQTGQMSPLMAMAHGVTLPPQAFQQQSSGAQSSSPATPAPIGAAAAQGAKTGAAIGSGDTSASDDSQSSPLASAVQSQQQQPPTPGAVPVKLANGQVVYGRNLKLESELAGLAKTNQELTNATLSGQKTQMEIGQMPAEEARKTTGQLEELKTKFDSATKDAQSQLQGARQISDALLSGNPISAKMAQTQLPMLALGVSRLSGSVISEAESDDTMAAIKNLIAKKTTGAMSAKELSLVQNASKLMESSAAQELNTAGDQISQSAANAGVPKSADFIKNKILLPQGVDLQVPQTAVKVHPQTGQAEVFKKVGNSWQLVPRSQ